LVGLRLENVDVFYGHSEYFRDIWNILGTFGIFYYHLVQFVFDWYIFFRFWYHVPRKIWQPLRACLSHY
jgi:hypothetical protein